MCCNEMSDFIKCPYSCSYNLTAIDVTAWLQNSNRSLLGICYKVARIFPSKGNMLTYFLHISFIFPSYFLQPCSACITKDADQRSQVKRQL